MLRRHDLRSPLAEERYAISAGDSQQAKFPQARYLRRSQELAEAIIALASLELFCFGAPTARLAAREPPAEVRWRKHLGLLVYLALSPNHRRSRDHLIGMFWSEQPERAAHKSLNQAIFRLRSALGPERLLSDADALEINAESLEIDAAQFTARAQTAPDDALNLLHGDFLEGFHIDGAPEFEDWMMHERDRYRALATTTLVTAGERRLAAGRLQEAEDAARRALAVVPHHEPAIRLLMRAKALKGDGAGAAQAYRDFAEQLERETGQPPGRALASLAQRIREQPRRPADTGAPPPVPLVGREQLHRAVFDVVVASTTPEYGPRTIVITSPPELGRSRLLAECTSRLALEGALVLQARPVESDHDAPWSALRLMFHSGFADAAGLLAARRDALSTLAGVVPALGERFAARPAQDVADMANALSEAFGAIAGERPLALAIDDAHWADGATIAALGAAVAGHKHLPLTLILTVGEGVGEPPRELLRLQSQVGRELPGVTAHLAALDQTALGVLVRAMATWLRSDEQRDRLTRRIAFESAGNPFFAVTLLGAMAQALRFRDDMIAWPPPGGTFDTPLPITVPDVVRHAIVIRVSDLSHADLRILSVASVCGQALEVDLIAEVAEVAPKDVEAALPAFERRYLIHLGGHRYTFVAPLIAQVVRRECATPSQRRAFEQRAADALEQRPGLENRVLRAELLARVKPDRESFDFAAEVERDATKAGARRVAARAAAAARKIEAQLGTT